MTYGISVVRASDGTFRTNYYRKRADDVSQDFSEALWHLYMYGKGTLGASGEKIFREEPVMRDLSESEERIVQIFREIVLELGGLENLVDVPSIESLSK